MNMHLSNIAEYVEDRISSEKLAIENYVTTDCILPDKQGRTIAANLPPQKCTLTKYTKGDILIANIRPYLKKIWLADSEGGASNDVLVFRAKEGYNSSFVYAVLLQDTFYDWVMKAPRGSQMPRGDRDHIMNFCVSNVPNQEKIGKILSNLDQKIALNRSINANLEALARQLYEYWFVQFDFPDANGKPYKSSGGKMVYNEKLKREIPEGWNICRLEDFIKANNTGDWGADEIADGLFEVGCIRGADILTLTDIPKRYIKSESKLLSEHDIVIEASGGSPIQATGRSAYVTKGVIERNGGKITCSNFCHAFTLKDIHKAPFFYYSWRLLYDNDNMFNYEGKTSGLKNFMTEMFLKNYWIDIPDDLAINFFNKVSMWFAQIDNNIAEMASLTRQRDELLPLLMNGQVSVE